MSFFMINVLSLKLNPPTCRNLGSERSGNQASLQAQICSLTCLSGHNKHLKNAACYSQISNFPSSVHKDLLK